MKQATLAAQTAFDETAAAQASQSQLPPPGFGGFSGYVPAHQKGFTGQHAVGGAPPGSSPGLIHGAGQDGQFGRSTLEEPSLRDLLTEMKALRVEGTAFRTSVESKIDDLQMQYTTLHKELQSLKEEVVTKQVFSKLESRVASLEAGGLACGQIKWIQE